MPRYFFHFHDGRDTSEDETGLDLPSAEHAYLEAVAAARAMWPELLAERTNPTTCAFEIADAQGSQLFRLAFTELLDACRTRLLDRSPPPILQTLVQAMARVEAAKIELRREFSQARRTLGESSKILERLSTFNHPASRSSV